MGFVLISALVLLPVVELIVAIKVGSAIGILPLLALLIATGVAGAALLRWQGLNAARRTFEQLARHEVPVDSMIDGLGLSLAGFLLLLPGLVSDAAALLLLVPAIRRKVMLSMMGLVSWRWTGRDRVRPNDIRPGRSARGPVEPGAERSPSSGSGVVIDGEFERLDERTIRPDRGGKEDDGSSGGATGSSPWRR